jgi:molybdate transport system regulatory protein
MVFTDLVPTASVTVVHRGIPVMGEREARLLEAVERVHSIKDAAREAGISYRTAWGTIQLMEKVLGQPVVESRAGGPGGGVSTLTEDCRGLLRVYQALRRRLEGDLTRAWEAAGGDIPSQASG